ncbi:MAG: chemotaxis protein CheW [Gallionella sp.]|nr:chemotaxis protein CheW [Gallionella sp.]
MANHLNLREFQQNLSDRMLASSGDAQKISTLGVIIAGQNWLVNMADISEVLPVQERVAVPMAKIWVSGVANVRGSLYCVADIAAYLGLGKVSGAAENRMLLVAGRYAFNAALLVDKVSGLRDARNWRNEQEKYRDEQDAIWHKLDIGNLLAQADFLQIGA